MSRTTVTVSFYGPSIETWAGAAWGAGVGLALWAVAYYVLGGTEPALAYVLPQVGFWPATIIVSSWLEGRSR